MSQPANSFKFSALIRGWPFSTTENKLVINLDVDCDDDMVDQVGEGDDHAIVWTLYEVGDCLLYPARAEEVKKFINNARYEHFVTYAIVDGVDKNIQFSYDGHISNDKIVTAILPYFSDYVGMISPFRNLRF